MTSIRNYRVIKVVLVILLMLVAATGGRTGTPAKAAAREYTGVLEDLRQAEEFEFSRYPENATDNSMQVIQIAESTDGELFIYVYQPSWWYLNLTATTARISTTTGEAAKWTDYKLTLINSENVFYKYKVTDFEVRPEPVRNYDIVALHRKWNKTIDKPTGNDNEINEVACEVGQLWTARTSGGAVTYEVRATEVITVTEKYVGRVRYLDGFYLFANESCDGWYVAFNTDKKIEKLYEADIEYQSQYHYYKGIIVGGKHYIQENNSEAAPHKSAKTLSYTESVSNAGDGWFGKKYTWNRIESAAEFRTKEDLTDEAKKQLNGKQWVLRFTETAYGFEELPVLGVLMPGSFRHEYTDISEVTILRLRFETNGKAYNLGVVDNKQTGNKISNKLFEIVKRAPWWVWLIVALAALIIIVIILKLVLRRRSAEAEAEARKPKRKTKKAGKKK